MATQITTCVEDRIATITLDGPDRLNAMTAAAMDAFVAALNAVDRDDEVRVVIVTGAGRGFCAGTDLSGGFDLPSGGDPVTGVGIPADVGAKVTLRLYRMNKPVIGAIKGAAVGFGASVTLAMDVRIASADARFGFVFTRRGIVAESCSSWFLPRIVGLATAAEWMISGRMIGSDEALRKGLVHEVVEGGDVLARAREIAADIIANTAPVSVALTRRLLWQMLGAETPEIAHEFESRALVAALSLDDAGEAVAAFKAKRPARFSGSVSGNDLGASWWPAGRAFAPLDRGSRD